jgi:hypothetical protein
MMASNSTGVSLRFKLAGQATKDTGLVRDALGRAVHARLPAGGGWWRADRTRRRRVAVPVHLSIACGEHLAATQILPSVITPR